MSSFKSLVTSPRAWRASERSGPSCVWFWPNGKQPWPTCTRPQHDTTVLAYQTITDNSRLSKVICPEASTNVFVQFNSYKYNANESSQGTKIQFLILSLWHPCSDFDIKIPFTGILLHPARNRGPNRKLHQDRGSRIKIISKITLRSRTKNKDPPCFCKNNYIILFYFQ